MSSERGKGPRPTLTGYLLTRLMSHLKLSSPKCCRYTTNTGSEERRRLPLKVPISPSLLKQLAGAARGVDGHVCQQVAPPPTLLGGDGRSELIQPGRRRPLRFAQDPRPNPGASTGDPAPGVRAPVDHYQAPPCTPRPTSSPDLPGGLCHSSSRGDTSRPRECAGPERAAWTASQSPFPDALPSPGSLAEPGPLGGRRGGNGDEDGRYGSGRP